MLKFLEIVKALEKVSKIKSKVYRHSKQATSNRDKIKELKKDDK